MKYPNRYQLKHGHAKLRSPTYRVWSQIKRRCLVPTNKDYRYYGARGISVCERWWKFENFLADMGERPANRSIDRINNNGNYEPGNCRWATVVEQQRNRGNIIMLTFKGETKPLTAWAEQIGLKEKTLRARIYDSGWPVDLAISTPLCSYNSHG